MKNLLKNIPATLPEELLETLVQTANIHIERIVYYIDRNSCYLSFIQVAIAG